MSTRLNQLVSHGIVDRYPVDLGTRRLPTRQLYRTPEFVAWCQSLSNPYVVAGGLVSPAAEMDATASAFVGGRRVVTIMRKIMPDKHGILRLFTASFTLIGWADGPQSLVLSQGITTGGSHGPGALAAKRKDAVAERSLLQLSWDGRHFSDLFRFQG